VDKTTSGTKINLKAKKGLVIVNFWASWCRPCVSEFKTLNKLKDKYQDKVFILGINNDEEEPRKKVAMIQSKYKLKFESLVDPKGNYASEFNILALPASIVYHNGKVIAFYNKEHDFMSDEFLELIDSHL
jgi:thiol-disulfide isomerase/thioredoxin